MTFALMRHAVVSPMRTDHRMLTALLRPLRAHVEQITARADNQARTAGLTVEACSGVMRRYRDPRMDQLTAIRRPAPYSDVRRGAAPVDASPWSTPILTVSAAAGWSR